MKIYIPILEIDYEYHVQPASTLHYKAMQTMADAIQEYENETGKTLVPEWSEDLEYYHRDIDFGYTGHDFASFPGDEGTEFGYIYAHIVSVDAPLVAKKMWVPIFERDLSPIPISAEIYKHMAVKKFAEFRDSYCEKLGVKRDDLDRSDLDECYWNNECNGSSDYSYIWEIEVDHTNAEVDLDAARDLLATMQSKEVLYREMIAIVQNHIRMYKRSVYDHSLAAKAYLRLVDKGAKLYCSEMGGIWNQRFSPALRRETAQMFADDNLNYVNGGEEL